MVPRGSKTKTALRAIAAFALIGLASAATAAQTAPTLPTPDVAAKSVVDWFDTAIGKILADGDAPRDPPAKPETRARTR